MNITLASSSMPTPAANPAAVKSVLKNEKAARDFEAMLLTPVLDSLQKTFAGDSEDAENHGGKRLSPDGNPGAGAGDRGPGWDWHRAAHLAPFAATKGIGWGLNGGFISSAKVFPNSADLRFDRDASAERPPPH